MKGYAELGQRSRPNTNDIRLALSEFGYSAADLVGYLDELKEHRMDASLFGYLSKRHFYLLILVLRTKFLFLFYS